MPTTMTIIINEREGEGREGGKEKGRKDFFLLTSLPLNSCFHVLGKENCIHLFSRQIVLVFFPHKDLLID